VRITGAVGSCLRVEPVREIEGPTSNSSPSLLGEGDRVKRGGGVLRMQPWFMGPVGQNPIAVEVNSRFALQSRFF
jgi:hypothetical protein